MSEFCNIDFEIKNHRIKDGINIANQLEGNISVEPINNNLNSKLNVNIYDKYFNNKNIDMKVNQIDNIEFKNVKILNNNIEEWAKSADPNKTIEGLGLNRWYNLCKNPQENSIEKFPRIGMNSVLDSLDSHKPCPVTNEMLNGFGI